MKKIILSIFMLFSLTGCFAVYGHGAYGTYGHFGWEHRHHHEPRYSPPPVYRPPFGYRDEHPRFNGTRFGYEQRRWEWEHGRRDLDDRHHFYRGR